MKGKVKLKERWKRTTAIDIVNHLVYTQGPITVDQILIEMYEPNFSGRWDAIQARSRIEEMVNRLIHRRRIEKTLEDGILKYKKSDAKPRPTGFDAMRRQRQQVNSHSVG